MNDAARARPQQDVNPAASDSLGEYEQEKTYEPAPVKREEHAESTLTRLIEQQTAKVPSDVFLFAAFSAMGASLTLELLGKHKASRFIGMWPPSLLIMGVYNKLVKVAGLR